MKKLKHINLIVSMVLMLAIIFMCNISFALLFDKVENNGVISFGQVKLNYSLNEDLNFETEDLIANNEIDRNLTLINPDNSLKSYVRIFMEFKLNNIINTDFLMLEIDNASWFKSESGKYYLKQPLEQSTTLNISLKFIVTENVKNEQNSFSIKLYIEGNQFTEDKSSISSWDEDFLETLS